MRHRQQAVKGLHLDVGGRRDRGEPVGALDPIDINVRHHARQADDGVFRFLLFACWNVLQDQVVLRRLSLENHLGTFPVAKANVAHLHALDIDDVPFNPFSHIRADFHAALHQQRLGLIRQARVKTRAVGRGLASPRFPLDETRQLLAAAFQRKQVRFSALALQVFHP